MLPRNSGGATSAPAAIEVGGQQQPRFRGGAHEGTAAVHDPRGAAPRSPPAIRLAGQKKTFSKSNEWKRNIWGVGYGSREEFIG